MTSCTWLGLNVLHVICIWLRPGHFRLSLNVWDSWCSKENVGVDAVRRMLVLGRHWWKKAVKEHSYLVQFIMCVNMSGMLLSNVETLETSGTIVLGRGHRSWLQFLVFYWICGLYAEISAAADPHMGMSVYMGCARHPDIQTLVYIVNHWMQLC